MFGIALYRGNRQHFSRLATLRRSLETAARS